MWTCKTINLYYESCTASSFCCIKEKFVSCQQTNIHMHLYTVEQGHITEVFNDWMTLLQFLSCSTMIVNIKEHTCMYKWVFTVYWRGCGHSVSINTCPVTHWVGLDPQIRGLSLTINLGLSYNISYYYASVGGARRRHTVVVVCVCVCECVIPQNTVRIFSTIAEH